MKKRPFPVVGIMLNVKNKSPPKKHRKLTNYDINSAVVVDSNSH